MLIFQEKKEIASYEDAIKIFDNWAYDLVIVEGQKQTPKSSTIIDLDQLKILREGMIDGYKIIEELKKAKDKEKILNYEK